jgi:hypothetical protein
MDPLAAPRYARTKCDLCSNAASWSMTAEPNRRTSVRYFACDEHRRRLTDLLRDRLAEPGEKMRVRAQSVFPF